MKKNHPLFVVIIIISVSIIAGCQTAPKPSAVINTPDLPTLTPIPPTVTIIPPTLTPLPPTLTPTPTVILVSELPIAISGYSITFTGAQFTDIGWNPLGLPSNYGLILSVSEANEKFDELTQLGAWFTDAE
jgi:hypothetical protein